MITAVHAMGTISARTTIGIGTIGATGMIVAIASRERDQGTCARKSSSKARARLTPRAVAGRMMTAAAIACQTTRKLHDRLMWNSRAIVMWPVAVMLTSAPKSSAKNAGWTATIHHELVDRSSISAR